MKDFLQSLHTLDQLDVSLVLAGHDDIFSDLHGRVKELIAHHDHRNEEVLGILDGQGKTAYDVAPRISWVTDAASWRNLSSLDKRFAVLETLAHLEYLHSLGKAQKTSTNGKVLFKRVASNK